jgi:hypothetical protein
MSLINLSELTTDPDFCQNFTVLRSVGGEFGEGGWVAGEEEEIEVVGVVVPSSGKELMQIDMADRPKGSMSFYTNTAFPIYTTRNLEGQQEISDKIRWQGEIYKLLIVEPFLDYGFYKALGVRVVGD